MVSSVASSLSSLCSSGTFSLETATANCKPEGLYASVAGLGHLNHALLLRGNCALRHLACRCHTWPGLHVAPIDAGVSTTRFDLNAESKRHEVTVPQKSGIWTGEGNSRKQRLKPRCAVSNVSRSGTLADKPEKLTTEKGGESPVSKTGDHGRSRKHSQLDERVFQKQTIALSERLLNLQLPETSQSALEAGKGFGYRARFPRQKAKLGAKHSAPVQADSGPLTPADEKQALKAFAQRFQTLPDASPLNSITPLVKDLGLALTSDRANQVLARLQERRRWRHALMLVRWMEQQKEHPVHKETYAQLFTILAEAGQHDKVAECYQALRRRDSVRPDHRNLLRIFGQGGCLQAAREVLDDLRSRGVQPDVMAYNHVINACAPGGHVSDAEAVLREMEKDGLAPSSVTYGTMIEVMGRGGVWVEAVGYFERYVGAGYEPTGATYKKLVQALAGGGQVALAEKYLLEAKRKGLVPHAAAFSALARAHAAAGDWRKGVEVLRSMPAEALGQRPMVVSLTGLIVALDRAGRLGEGLEVLEYMHGADGCAPNLATYTTMVNALVREGEVDKAEALIQVMRARGFEPDVRTWGGLLSACARKGLTGQIRQLLFDMKSAGCEPDARCFESLVRAYVNQGRVSEGLELLTGLGAKGIPLRQEIYATLMEACGGGVRAALAKGVWDHALAHFSEAPSARLTAAYMESLLSQGLHDEALAVFRRFETEHEAETETEHGTETETDSGNRSEVDVDETLGTNLDVRFGAEPDFADQGKGRSSQNETELKWRNERVISRLYALAIEASGGTRGVLSDGVLGTRSLRNRGDRLKDGDQEIDSEGFRSGESLEGKEVEGWVLVGGELERDALGASERREVMSVMEEERREKIARMVTVERDPERSELERRELTDGEWAESRRFAEAVAGDEGDGVKTALTENVPSGGAHTEPEEGGPREEEADGQCVGGSESAHATTWAREGSRYSGGVVASDQEPAESRHTGREGVTDVVSVNRDNEPAPDASPAVQLYQEVLQKRVPPSNAVFLALLQFCRKHGELREALKVPDQMVAAGLRPKVKIYNELLLVCSAVGNWAAGVNVKERMVSEGVKPDRYTFNIWIRFAGRCQKPDAAIAAFEDMPKVGVERTLVTWNTLISALGAAGRWRDALARFRVLPEGLTPSVVTYGIVVRMLARLGRVEDGLEVLEEMRHAGFAPDVRIYNALGEALYVAQRWETFLEFVQGMEKRGLVCNSTLSGRVRMVKKRLHFEKATRPKSNGRGVVEEGSSELSGANIRRDDSPRSYDTFVGDETKGLPSNEESHHRGELERGLESGFSSSGNEQGAPSEDPDGYDTWQSDTDAEAGTNGGDARSVKRGVDWRWITGVPYRAPRGVDRKRRKEARITGRHAKEWVHHTGRGTNEDLIRLLGSENDGPGIPVAIERESRHLEQFRVRAPDESTV